MWDINESKYSAKYFALEQWKQCLLFKNLEFQLLSIACCENMNKINLYFTELDRLIAMCSIIIRAVHNLPNNLWKCKLSKFLSVG